MYVMPDDENYWDALMSWTHQIIQIINTFVGPFGLWWLNLNYAWKWNLPDEMVIRYDADETMQMNDFR